MFWLLVLVIVIVAILAMILYVLMFATRQLGTLICYQEEFDKRLRSIESDLRRLH